MLKIASKKFKKNHQRFKIPKKPQQTDQKPEISTKPPLHEHPKNPSSADTFSVISMAISPYHLNLKLKRSGFCAYYECLLCCFECTQKHGNYLISKLYSHMSTCTRT